MSLLLCFSCGPGDGSVARVRSAENSQTVQCRMDGDQGEHSSQWEDQEGIHGGMPRSDRCWCAACLSRSGRPTSATRTRAGNVKTAKECNADWTANKASI